jgi:hypothetical protein
MAGYVPDDGNAAKLEARPEIQVRIHEITSKGAERAEVTVASLLNELDHALALAMSIEQPAAAVAAIREKGILSGKRIERLEQGEPGEFERLDDGELLVEIMRMNSEANVSLDEETQH